MTETDDLDNIDESIDEDDEELYAPEFEVPLKPMKRAGGANFRTKKLTFPRPDLAVFNRTLGLILFSGAFMSAGVFMGIMGIVFCLKEVTSANVILPAIFFVGFGGAGYWVWRSTATVTFDRISGCFWRGRRKPDTGRQDNETPIERIDCLQVLVKYVSGSDSSYYSYELNLVLNDPPGERFLVMAHGKSGLFWDDACELAEFLDKPIWDCTDQE